MSFLLKVTLILFIFSGTAHAGSFKGYGKTAPSKEIKIEGPLDTFEEEAQTFLILIAKHSAFYKFPKDAASAENVRQFLKARLKNKKTLVLEVDPVTTEIHVLRDL